MAQKRKHSLLETCLSTAVGYVIAITSQVIVLPWFNIHVPISTNLQIGLIFTVISVARSYVFRRLFNHFTG